MAKKRDRQDAARKKAAKQKKVLIVLVVFLLGALVYGYMSLSGGGGKPQVSGTPAAQTTPAGAIPTDGSAATVTPGVAAPPVASMGSFASLGRKDPFHDDGPHATTGASSAPSKSGGSSKSAGGKSAGSKGGGGGSKSRPPAAPPLTGAVISLNGKKLPLAIGTTFGHAPGLSGVSLFRLITVSARSAVIGVVGTRQRFTLHVRRPLTLSQNGGWTYTLILEPVGSAGPMTVQPTTTIADQKP